MTIALGCNDRFDHTKGLIPMKNRLERVEGGARRSSRQEAILTRLRAVQGELSVEELSRFYGVSPLTIRRDLEQLEQDSVLVRTHGGCLLRGSIESTYQRRIALNFELKQAIGRAAAEELKEARTILINDGSTTFHLASHIRVQSGTSVYTNSIALVRELSRFPEIRLFVLGGEFDRDLQLLGGSLTELILESLNFDVVFLGANAIDQEGRCLVPSLSEARLTRIMLKRAKRKILLADHTKCHETSHATYGNLSDFDVWVTTPEVPARLAANFRKLVNIVEATV
jgi:DeoR family transcriptional regulator, fructose operon transcriptional repressor